jgi:hypothetical protein
MLRAPTVAEVKTKPDLVMAKLWCKTGRFPYRRLCCRISSHASAKG